MSICRNSVLELQLAKELIKHKKIHTMGKKEEKVAQEEIQDEVKDQAEVAEKVEATPEEKLQAAEDKFLRLFSEFENFRRRTVKEKSDLIANASADVYKVIIPILDDLDRAKENADKATDLASLKEGIDLIFDKLTKSFAAKGLEEMDVKEQDFNADEHEAITNIPAPTKKLKGKVLDVVEKGYKLNGKIIRFPKVVVGA